MRSINPSKSLILVFAFLMLTLITTNVFSKNLVPSKKSDSIQTKHQPWDKFSISFGGFFANYNSGITLGSEQLGLGLLINMEDAFGLEANTWALRGKANYRFGKTRRHEISAGYFQINRKAFKQLGKDLEIGDITIPLGTEFTTKFNFTILRAKYDYSFYQDDRVSLGASIGVFVLPISFSLQVENDEAESASMLAPLPVIGLRTDFLITKKFYYRQSLEVLYLAFEGFSGGIVDLDISLEYRPIHFLGVGLGLNSTKLHLTSEGDSYPNIDFFGNITSEYVGIYLFAKYNL